MGARLTISSVGATMEQVTIPSPFEFESKVEHARRVGDHPAILRAYPSSLKRFVAIEKRWAKAKLESIVSVTTEAGEVLLFD